MKPQCLKGIVAIVLSGLILITIIAILQFTQPHAISFSVVESGYSLIAPTGLPRQEPDPLLIIIANPEDMVLPAMLKFPESLAERIKQMDFSKSFVILVIRGHPERGLVKEIVRHQETVIITTYDIEVGPGNYVLPNWTQPYEIIKIDKEGMWGKQIRFVLQRETQGILGEVKHFVP